MSIDDIFALAPQKTFLLQSAESGFDTFLTTALLHNPFTSALSVSRFTTDHARNLVEFINESTGTDRLFIVFFSFFSPDAAQILLKSLEEPDPDTTIVLMTPYPYLVPITIRSRIMLLHSNAIVHSSTQPALEPRNMSRDAMLAEIKEEFGSDAEEDAATRRAKAIELLDMFEQHVRSNPEKASIIYNAKHMLFAGNLPTKYVLEYAASMVL